MKDLPALVVLLPLIACAADREPRKKDAGRKVEQAAIDYRGPKVHASIDGSQLAVDIHVHSGGFGLALLRTVAVTGMFASRWNSPRRPRARLSSRRSRPRNSASRWSTDRIQ